MTAVTRVAGAATLIAGLTVLARLVGFARTVVFTNTVDTKTDLGSVYQAANTLPNIVFELVAGGALASLVVPLLAGAIVAGDRERVSALTSALLTWVLVLLVLAGVLVAVLADPIAGLLPAEHRAADDIALTARMLRVFAPQLPLYGVGIVLAGVLQAHRRFAWPVIAPLLSSVTVIAAYLGYAVVDRSGTGVAGLSAAGEVLLTVGTTAGVAVLSLCLVFPVRRLGLRLRPVRRFPDGAGRQALRLGWSGAVTVGTQQVALLTAMVLALRVGENLYAPYLAAQAVYLLPWAVLAVPVATAAYPGLATAYAAGDLDGYREQVARTTRSVLLLSCLGAGALVAVAAPAAVVLNDPRDAAVLVWLAPGLLGYGLFALLSRALYARHAAGATAGAVALGWAVAVVASIVLAVALPAGLRLPALAAGNSVGMLALGGLLLLAVRRRAGSTALAGGGRAATVGVLAAVLSAAAGRAVVALLDGPFDVLPGTLAAVLAGLLGGLVTLVVFAAVVWPLDGRDLAPAVTALRRRLRRRRPADARPADAEPRGGPTSPRSGRMAADDVAGAPAAHSSADPTTVDDAAGSAGGDRAAGSAGGDVTDNAAGGAPAAMAEDGNVTGSRGVARGAAGEATRDMADRDGEGLR